MENASLGKVTFDFPNGLIEFDRQGRRVVLRGKGQKPPLTMGEHKKQQLIQEVGEINMLQIMAIQGEEFDYQMHTPQVHTPLHSPVHEDIQQLLQEYQSLKIQYPLIQKNVIEQLTKVLLDQGVIKHSSSAFASPMVLVKKKDGWWRMCIDYRSLNKNTIQDRFPIPLVEELLDELHGT
ncbi:hypothetical protein Tco_1460800 [Tanacetum coccineum]